MPDPLSVPDAAPGGNGGAKSWWPTAPSTVMLSTTPISSIIGKGSEVALSFTIGVVNLVRLISAFTILVSVITRCMPFAGFLIACSSTVEGGGGGNIGVVMALIGD